MRFQFNTLVATLCMAGVIYAIGVYFVIKKIELQLGIKGQTLGVTPPPPPWTVMDWIIVGCVGVVPGLLLAVVVTGVWMRRINRRSPNHCSHCGIAMLPAQTRCECCGTRRLSRGTDEALFPVDLA